MDDTSEQSKRPPADKFLSLFLSLALLFLLYPVLYEQNLVDESILEKVKRQIDK